jgi:hypothetical protein
MDIGEQRSTADHEKRSILNNSALRLDNLLLISGLVRIIRKAILRLCYKQSRYLAASA